jgi:hypothetical protein
MRQRHVTAHCAARLRRIRYSDDIFFDKQKTMVWLHSEE